MYVGWFFFLYMQHLLKKTPDQIENGIFDEVITALHFDFLLSPSALLSDEGRADVCGRKASHFFSLAESLRSPAADPFIWVFIRPPWSPTGSCCKAVVFDRLKAECDSNVVCFASDLEER